MTKARTFIAVVLTVGLLGTLDAQQQKFYPDDPLRVDLDNMAVPVEPAEIDLSDMFDRFGHIAADLGSTELTEAHNVNTLDEVPDSSRFTNRHGVERTSIDELVRGPNTVDGPDMSVPWRVFRSKIGGLTPGFQIIDGRGDRYVIKFDPVGVPELSSAAEIIGTKLFYAMGYNTPENYIVSIDPEAGLTIEPGTILEDEFGDEEPLTRGFLRRRTRQVPRLPDGRIRVTASRYIPGRPIGPFRYYSTRTDDPNDVIEHENRRELRGLRLFAAWTNHDDTRAQNTQDSWVEEGGVPYIRHFLMDFGSTFGSGSVDLQLPKLSVPCGDGRNPSPSGEEKSVVVWSRAPVSPWSAHENGPQRSPGVDPEISEARVDWRGGGSCARFDPPDSAGARVGSPVRKSGTRPRPRVCFVSPESGHQHDCPVAEGDQLAGAPSGVSALAQSVLG